MKKLRGRFRRDAPAAIFFLAPSLAGFLLFYIVPFGAVLYYSLIDTPVNGNFVGFENYKELWDSASFRKAFVNSMLFTFAGVPAIFAVSLALSFLLYGKLPLRRTFRTIFLLPLVVPVASVTLIWQALFHWNGAVNGILASLTVEPEDWMNSDWAFAVMLLVYVWKNAGYNLVIFLAGLSNIPEEQYEAASLDGAGVWRRFFHITLPGLAPASFFIIVMSMVQSFRIFRETYLVAGAYPHDAVYTLQHFMNNRFQALDYPKLTAAAILLTLVFGLSMYGLFRAERMSEEALKA